MKKLLLGTLAIATVFLVPVPAAFAGEDISIGLVVDGWSYQPSYDDDYSPSDDDWGDDYDEEDQISCREGRSVVRSSGYRQVVAIKCEGNIYRYQAIRGGNVWSVKVSAWSGDIVSARIIGFR